VDSGEVAAGKIIESISSCCSKQPEFITGEMPVLESAFRIILAGGNKPISTGDIAGRMRELRKSVPAETPAESFFVSSATTVFTVSAFIRNEAYQFFSCP
jgi:hypothetical protein